MRWCTIYKTTSMVDVSRPVVRVHDIGDSGNMTLEMSLGTLNFNDPEIFAVVCEEHARETAQLISNKLGLPLEL